jgi:hypothetical protein
MAGLMVVMAVGLELAKPLAVACAFAAFRSWALARGVALALLAIVAVAYSLTAELTLMSMARGDLVAERSAATKLAKSTDGQRERIEAELAKLSTARPAATVRAEIAGMLADARIGDCSTMDGPRSKAACPTVNRLRAELGNAERREKLEGDLAALLPAKPTDGAADKPADPGAHALSVYFSAMGLSVPAGLLTDWLTLVPVLALEVGAALSAVLIQAVGGHQTASLAEQKAAMSNEGTPARPESTALDSKTPATKPRAASKRTTAERASRRRLGQRRRQQPSVSKAEAESKVVSLIKDSGGTLERASARTVAKLIGGKKSTVHSALAGLIAAGVVAKAGTALVLAA